MLAPDLQAHLLHPSHSIPNPAAITGALCLLAPGLDWGRGPKGKRHLLPKIYTSRGGIPKLPVNYRICGVFDKEDVLFRAMYCNSLDPGH